MYTIEEIKNTLNPIFHENRIRSAILFGSYAKGQATERSDIDILVDSGLRGLAFYGLLEKVVSALTVPVDLIDASQIEAGSEIDNEIQNSGVMIYGMRNRIVHGYSGVKMQIVWDTVSEDIPRLHEELQKNLDKN